MDLDLSIQIVKPDWQKIFTIPKGTVLIKGRHGIYHDLVQKAGEVQNKFLCYSWGTKERIMYCGSCTKVYKNNSFRSTLHGRIHNYLQTHSKRTNGRINTNLMVFENVNQTLLTEDVVFSIFTFDHLLVGNQKVTFEEFSADPDLVLVVEQLLIFSYKRKGQSPWNRTPSKKMEEVKEKAVSISPGFAEILIRKRDMKNPNLRVRPSKKYQPLGEYFSSLQKQQKDITLSFTEIEKIIGARLPPSASKHPAWWSNGNNSGLVQTSAWRDNGWLVDEYDFNNKRVRFIRKNS